MFNFQITWVLVRIYLIGRHKLTTNDPKKLETYSKYISATIDGSQKKVPLTTILQNFEI